MNILSSNNYLSYISSYNTPYGDELDLFKSLLYMRENSSEDVILDNENKGLWMRISTFCYSRSYGLTVIDDISTKIRLSMYMNLTLNAQRYKYIVVRDEEHAIVCRRFSPKGLFVYNGDLISFHPKERKCSEVLESIMSKKRFVEAQNVKMAFRKFKLYKIKCCKMLIEVIFRWKRLVERVVKLKRWVILKFKQNKNRKYLSYRRSQYVCKLIDEKPCHTESTYRVTIDPFHVEVLDAGSWKEEYDPQMSSNFDILCKMRTLNFIKNTDIYQLSNIGSKSPKIFIQSGSKWQRLILVKHRMKLKHSDYLLMIKWTKKLESIDEYKAIPKARAPLKPYWSKLSSKIILTLRKMDKLHLVDSAISMWFPRICWTYEEFCYVIHRRILYQNSIPKFRHRS